MRTTSTLCLAAALVSGVAAQTDLELSFLRVGAADAEKGVTSATDQLVETLQEDEQVTVVGSVELGGFSCSALEKVVGASAVSMTIHEERLVADLSTYSLTDGDTFEDGISRHVWTGLVSEPEQAEDEAFPRSVSLSWGEDCTAESFLLKITKRKTDGVTSIIKTVPCLDSEETTCLVEVIVEFEEPGAVVVPEEYKGSSATEEQEPTGRRMQEGVDEPEYTVIDVMVLYTDLARQKLGGVSHIQMTTYLLESFLWTNQAFINSKTSVRFNPVLIVPAPFDEDTRNGVQTLFDATSDEAITRLRNERDADLVQIITHFNDRSCGYGFSFYDDEAYGYSVVKSTCLDNYVHTHEYGHNLGCMHNRENSYFDTEYSHGLRYCDSPGPYRTLMSYRCPRSEPRYAPYANYFSNPDVEYLGRATGRDTENNARTIEDTMVAVSNYRGLITPTPTPSPTEPPTDPPTTHLTEYSSAGCYKDSNKDRVLTGYSIKGDDAMTTENCAIICEGSAYFGTEYSSECFCGPATDDPMRLGPATCNRPCTGDADQTCGGRNAISLYKYSYSAAGCYKDNRDRVLTEKYFDSDDMTTQLCADYCTGSTYFGTQFSRQCFCSADSDDPFSLGEATCNLDCTGDASQTCGGHYALSLYQYPGNTVNRSFKGCFSDSKADRIMMNKISDPEMTTDICQELCSGYPFFGTQYGVECWCGDDDTDYDRHGESNACTFECSGEASETCGGRNAMSVYGARVEF